MRDPRRSQLERGFVQMELMLLIGLVGIGAAVGFPSLVKLLKHQTMSGGNWAALIIGVLLALAGFAPFIGSMVTSAFAKPRRR